MRPTYKQLFEIVVIGSAFVFAVTGYAKEADKSKKPAVAQFKCWQNKDGVKECGNAVPPEYSQQEHTAFSKQGMAVGHQEAPKSAEQVEADKLVAEQKKQEESRKQEAARKDRVLLQTFSSEDDLNLARDGKISTVEGQIKLTESHNKKLQSSLDQSIKSAADFERRGKEIPEQLKKNLDSTKQQIEENNRFIEAKRKEQDDIRKQFDLDLNRLRELRAAR
jgi:hypothetical protein